MGIQHIESLAPDAFIDFVKNISAYTITEKLDGTNIVIGRDIEGKLYTSREAKGGAKRYYHYADYDEQSPTNHGYMLAQQAIMSLGPVADELIKPGQAIECELLFGRQPNAIVYGTNRLVLLAPHSEAEVPYSDDEWDQVLNSEALEGGYGLPLQSHSVDFTPAYQLDINTCLMRIVICGVPSVEATLFAPTLEALSLLDAYGDWLDRGSVGSSLTNRELLEVNLTTILMAERPSVKTVRDSARAKSMAFKLDIKAYMIKVLTHFKSALRSEHITVNSSEDFGIEGVVVTSLDGQTVKIVNKKLFTAINAFNHVVRNRIRKTSHGKVPDNIEWAVDFNIKGDSLYDHMLTMLSSIHGLDGLNSYLGIKPRLRKFRFGDLSLTGTLDNIAAEWETTMSIQQIRGMVVLALRQHCAILQNCRQIYLTHSPGYYMRLDDGQVVGYSPAVHKRTLIMFAEVERELTEMIQGVRFAEDLQTIIYALFQKQLLSIH